jgi:hypothetical protein
MILRAMLVVVYATGRASHAREVKGDDPDKKGYCGPPGGGLGMRLTTSHHKKILLQNLKKKNRGVQDSPRAVEPMLMNRVFTTFLSRQHTEPARHIMLEMMGGGSISVLNSCMKYCSEVNKESSNICMEVPAKIRSGSGSY